MIDESANLLRRLGSGVIPDGAGSSVAGSPFEGEDLPTLLVGAVRGLIRTGRVVDVQAEIKPALTTGQLENIADAADLAQAAGAQNVIATIDGRALILDVAMRCISSEVPLGAPAQIPGDVMAGLDAIVVARPTAVAEPADENETQGVLSMPSAARRRSADLTQIPNRSVAELLAGNPENRRAG